MPAITLNQPPAELRAEAPAAANGTARGAAAAAWASATDPSRLKGLQCRECGQRFPIEPIHVCDFCFGPLEVEYDYALLASTVRRETIESGPLNIWRYRDLLPVNEKADTGWRVGFTPLQPAPRLGTALRGRLARRSRREALE